jgi:hypothetical protein
VHIEFTHSRTPEYFRRRFGPAGAVLAAPFQRLAAAGIVIAVVIVLAGEASRKSLLTGGALLLTAAMMDLIGRRRRQREVTVSAGWLAPRTWVLTDDSFTSYTDQSSNEFAWPVFRTLLETPDAYVLGTGRPKYYDIPREPLDALQDAELRAFLHGLALTTETAA